MEHHLRLAEARGSLTAPNSRVQDLALEMLIILRQAEKQQALIDRIRVEALRSPIARERLTEVFPDMWPPDPFDEARQEDGSYDIDSIKDEDLDWATPTDESVDEDLSAWINQREGSITAADLDDGWR